VAAVRATGARSGGTADAEEPQLLGSRATDVAPLGRIALAADLPDTPDGSSPAEVEAALARARAEGRELSWAPASDVGSFAALRRLFRLWGEGAPAQLRREPSLLPFLQIGAWFDASLRARLLRRVALHLPSLPFLGRRAAVGLARRVALDAAFWSGVRRKSTRDEWLRLTRGYAVLLYHEVAPVWAAEDERLVVSPESFDRQMRLLRRFRFRTLGVDELLELHHQGATSPRRAVVVTADDALTGCVDALIRNRDVHPQLFVPTGRTGRHAAWMRHGRIADDRQLSEAAAAGITLGAHTRTHARLVEVSAETLHGEVEGSRRDLERLLGQPPLLFAYPHGASDVAARAAVRASGYALAYTTSPGRNGAGSDPHALRRSSVKAWDSALSFLWKALTAEPVPARWERRLHRRHRSALPRAPRGRGGAPGDEASPPPTAD